MFSFPVKSENVKGIPVSDFKANEMERVRDEVIEANHSPALVILITPWDRDNSEESNDYYRTKHIFVSARISSQVVQTSTLARDTQLKWSTSNIALQNICEAGGTTLESSTSK